MVKVKVCGITNLNDAKKAVEFGADALGFNFYSLSPRCVAPATARAILQVLPKDVCNVALFVNERKQKVQQILGSGRLGDGRQAYGCLQFHGEESRDYCSGWQMKIIKAFRGRFLPAGLVVGWIRRIGSSVCVGLAGRIDAGQANSFRRSQRGKRR